MLYNPSDVVPIQFSIDKKRAAHAPIGSPRPSSLVILTVPCSAPPFFVSTDIKCHFVLHRLHSTLLSFLSMFHILLQGVNAQVVT